MIDYNKKNCDICGRKIKTNTIPSEIPNNGSLLHLSDDIIFITSGLRGVYSLCDGCVDGLVSWIEWRKRESKKEE